MLHWRMLKQSMVIALIGHVCYACNAHCEEYELMQEDETFLISEDQTCEQTKVHPFLSLDEEDAHCRELFGTRAGAPKCTSLVGTCNIAMSKIVK